MIERKRTDEKFHVSAIFDRKSKPRERRSGGTFLQAAQQIPIYHRCDVLVIGGGPSGTAAAAAAAREGADVTLLERYNHLGGLSTGGLVIWIDRMSDWQGQPVIRGLTEMLFKNL